MRKKNNYRQKRRIVLRANYYDRLRKWRDRKPPVWKWLAYIRWKSERPKEPKWMKEERMCEYE